MTEPNQDPVTDRPAPEALGPLVPPPTTPDAGQQYPAAPTPGPGFPPPPGTQYGTVQYGAGQYGAGQYGGQPTDSSDQPGGGQYSSGPYGAGPYGAAPYSAGPYGPGPYGASPYGYPQGYYGQQQGTSGLAIASLILGICGFFCVTPFISVGLGIGALVKIKNTGQPGKGMAIAGLILSGLWIALLVLLIVNGHITSGDTSGPSGGAGQGPDGTNA